MFCFLRRYTLCESFYETKSSFSSVVLDMFDKVGEKSKGIATESQNNPVLIIQHELVLKNFVTYKLVEFTIRSMLQAGKASMIVTGKKNMFGGISYVAKVFFRI